MCFHSVEKGLVFIIKSFLFMKKCRLCQIEKPFEEFNKNKNSIDGHVYKCKTCLKQYTKDLRDGKRMSKEEKDELMRLGKITLHETEREMTNQLLRSMGYEPDSLISIHEQFVVRHLVNKLILSNS